MAVHLRPLAAVTTVGKHDGTGTNTMTVAELLDREAKNGTPLSLHWPAQCLDPQGGVRNWHHDEWPTGELPRMTEELLAELDAEQELTEPEPEALPKRVPAALPPPDKALWEPEVELLGRLLHGLRGLE